MRVTQWMSKLQHAKDAYGSPPAREGLGFMKEFTPEISAPLDVARALRRAGAFPAPVSVARKLRGGLLEFGEMPIRAAIARGFSDALPARCHIPER